MRALSNGNLEYSKELAQLVAIFLLYATPQDTFVLITKLLADHRIENLFSPGFPLAYKYFFIQENLIEFFFPKLAFHFVNFSCFLNNGNH